MDAGGTGCQRAVLAYSSSKGAKRTWIRFCTCWHSLRRTALSCRLYRLSLAGAFQHLALISQSRHAAFSLRADAAPNSRARASYFTASIAWRKVLALPAFNLNKNSAFPERHLHMSRFSPFIGLPFHAFLYTMYFMTGAPYLLPSLISYIVIMHVLSSLMLAPPRTACRMQRVCGTICTPRAFVTASLPPGCSFSPLRTCCAPPRRAFPCRKVAGQPFNHKLHHTSPPCARCRHSRIHCGLGT